MDDLSMPRVRCDPSPILPRGTTSPTSDPGLAKLYSCVKASLAGGDLWHAIFVGDGEIYSEANQHELAKTQGHYSLAMLLGKLTEIHQEVMTGASAFVR